MKVISLVARILLGIIFIFFGTNLIYPFLHSPMPPGAAGQMVAGLFATHFWYLIGVCQVIGGLLMLIGRYVTLGLVILGPMVVCIDYFHLLSAHSGLPLAALVTLLWFIVAFAHKHHLAGIFAARA